MKETGQVAMMTWTNSALTNSLLAGTWRENGLKAGCQDDMNNYEASLHPRGLYWEGSVRLSPVAAAFPTLFSMPGFDLDVCWSPPFFILLPQKKPRRHRIRSRMTAFVALDCAANS